MSIGSGLAVYFVIWWIVLFTVLPWGVKTSQESGEPLVPGQADSAPARPNLWRKALWTSLISAILFGLFLLNRHFGWLTLDAMPDGGMPDRRL